LRTEWLRSRYEAGGSPLREALMRLESEGFVQLEFNKGFRVAGVSREHLLDLTRTRIEIEAVLLRWSIMNGDVEWEGNIVGGLHRLMVTPKEEPGESGAAYTLWLRLHREFHRSLIAAANSPILTGIWQRLFDQAERYVALSIAVKSEQRDDVAEHSAIAEAVISRDVAAAVELNRRHIELTTAKLERHYVVAELAPVWPATSESRPR
jgi:DNA-binding GntR family transcriptional regulator